MLCTQLLVNTSSAIHNTQHRHERCLQTCVAPILRTGDGSLRPLAATRLLIIHGKVTTTLIKNSDRLCGLVVTVPGYRSKGPGFYSRRYQIFWEVVGLERGPLGLVRITEELLEFKSSGSGSRKPRLRTQNVYPISQISSSRPACVCVLRLPVSLTLRFTALDTRWCLRSRCDRRFPRKNWTRNPCY
jgi:hypothetical protein